MATNARVNAIGTTVTAINHTAVTGDCDICGQTFRAKNAAAATMMLRGKLRVCDECRREGARTQLPYSEYLKTAHWQLRRERALDRAGHHCQVCHAIELLEVHHNTYERLGHERDADLVVLCRNCHQLFHNDGRLPY